MTTSQPDGPRGLPLVGVLPFLGRDPLGMLLDIGHRYPRIARLARNAYLVTDPDALHQIFTADAANFIKGASIDPLRPGIGNGLITSEGPFWRRQRRLAAPAFHAHALAGMTSQMVSAVDALVARWQPAAGAGGTLDLAVEMRSVTLDLVGRTLLGTRLDAEAARVEEALSVGLEITNRRFWSMIKLPYWLPTRDNRRFNAALATLESLVYRMIAERRAMPERGDALIDTFIAARDEDTGEAMTDRQLRDELMTLIIAGHDSTSQSLAWIFHLLSTHPPIYARVVEEIDRVLGGAEPTFERLSRLEYTTRVISEGLRLYPTAWLMSRSPVSDVTLCGYPIAANSILLLTPYVNHRLPSLWCEPDRFDPDRFEPALVEQRPKFAYFPFGGGPRSCIGRGFSILESLVILAGILRRYELTSEPGRKVEPEARITIRPRGGLPMTVRPRNGTLSVPSFGCTTCAKAGIVDGN